MILYDISAKNVHHLEHLPDLLDNDHSLFQKNLFLIKEIIDLEENRPGRSKKCSNRIQHQTGFVNIGIVTKKSRFKKLTNTKLFVKNLQKRSEYITICIVLFIDISLCRNVLETEYICPYNNVIDIRPDDQAIFSKGDLS